jgi:hypothetical protein
MKARCGAWHHAVGMSGRLPRLVPGGIGLDHRGNHVLQRNERRSAKGLPPKPLERDTSPYVIASAAKRSRASFAALAVTGALCYARAGLLRLEVRQAPLTHRFGAFLEVGRVAQPVLFLVFALGGAGDGLRKATP